MFATGWTLCSPVNVGRLKQGRASFGLPPPPKKLSSRSPPPQKCRSLYGATVADRPYAKEGAIRVLLHQVDVLARRGGRRIVPLLCVALDFYVRAFFPLYFIFFSSLEREDCFDFKYVFVACADSRS